MAFIKGTNGPDILLGTIGNDEIWGLGANDSLRGGSGDDKVFGFSGSDFIDGGLGNDFLDGGEGNDKVEGGEGNDELLAEHGVDALNGGPGDDILTIAPVGETRGSGANRLTGGPGADTFEFLFPKASDERIESIITDFDSGVDKLDLSDIDGVLVGWDPGNRTTELFVFTPDLTLIYSITIIGDDLASSDVILPDGARVFLASGRRGSSDIDILDEFFRPSFDAQGHADSVFG